MQHKFAIFLFGLVLLTVPIGANGQQKAEEEFVSAIGQFGIMLPATSPEFNSVTLNIGDDKLKAWLYSWELDKEQAIVIYAIGKVDLESKTDFYLETLRNNYAPGSIRTQKKISFAGHPGLVSVVDGNTGSAMIWTYLLKNRFYMMSLTLDDKSRTEDHLKLMSTFRLLSPKDIEPRVTSMVEELTPTPLAQASALSRPTTDAQDAALKGPVKTVITESEPYADGLLFGAVEMLSVENYDEHGNLEKTVDYRDSLPGRVRVYGSHNGERAFREITQVRRWARANDKNDSGIADSKPKPKLYTIKYKHDPDGKLLQMRVLRDDGKEMETANYNLKANTVTRRYDSEYLFIRKRSIGNMKVVSTLGANGLSTEDAYGVRHPPNYKERFEYSGNFGFTFFEDMYQHFGTDKERYEYKFDDRGNWIQRKTFTVKDKKTVPIAVTYRTIIYYQ
jgi:hypothetical protein